MTRDEERITWDARMGALNDWQLDNLATMCEALPVDPATLSERAQRILCWLSTWDMNTAEGVAELLTAVQDT